MSEFTVHPATAADDPEIRRLLATSPIDGPMAITYEREPDYFLGCPVMGPRCDVWVGRHGPSGSLAGMGCRAIRPVHLGGDRCDVGYLAQLRVASRFRGRALVARAFRHLRERDAGEQIPGYFTTVVEGNREAEGVLVRRPRPRMPTYQPVARVFTLVYATGRPPRAPRQLSDATQVDLGDVLRVLDRRGARRPLQPSWQASDFAPGAAATRGFAREDLLVATRGGRVAGTLGVWDQTAFKQLVVRSYGGALRWLRPWLSLLAPALRLPRLPRPPAVLRLAYGSFLAVDDDDPGVFRELLQGALARAAERGCLLLALGLAEADPLLEVARQPPHQQYTSRLFVVEWKGGTLLDRLRGSVPHVEIGVL